jgi:hypothetical protein
MRNEPVRNGFNNHQGLIRTIIIAGLVSSVLISLLCLASCEKTAPVIPSGNNDTTNNGNGGDPPVTSTLWNGLSLSSWQENIAAMLAGDTLKFPDASFKSIPVSVRGVTKATLTYDLAFSGETQSKSLAIVTYFKKRDGTHWLTNFGHGDSQISIAVTNQSLLVYDDSWSIQDSPLDSIYLKFNSFNQGQITYLIKPKITGE